MLDGSLLLITLLLK